jgi:hypothetical protein
MCFGTNNKRLNNRSIKTKKGKFPCINSFTQRNVHFDISKKQKTNNMEEDYAEMGRLAKNYALITESVDFCLMVIT